MQVVGGRTDSRELNSSPVVHGFPTPGAAAGVVSALRGSLARFSVS